MVSIIMPMKNAEKYIEDAIRSILVQTYSEFELVIINDQSVDDSENIVNSIEDPRIKLINGGGKGIAAALNLGLDLAKGKYVCRCDADDLFPEGRLQFQVDWLDRHPDYIAVAGKFSSIDDKNNVVSEYHTGDNEIDITPELLTGKTRTHLASFLVRRNTLNQLKGYREYFVTAEDIDMQFRIAEKGRIKYLPGNMYFYRIHDSSITHVQSSNKRIFYEGIAREFLKQRQDIGQDQLERNSPPKPPVIGDKPADSTEQIIGYMIAESWRLHGKKHKYDALNLSMKACMIKPLSWSVWKNAIMILVKK